MAEIKLSSTEFKALSSEKRIEILKSLKERNYTLTELAQKQNVSTPSMKQQLDQLMEAELIQKEDSQRKWKYYSLTRKGKNLLEGEENQHTILIVLGISAVLLIGTLMLMFNSLSGVTGMQASMEKPALKGMDEAMPATEYEAKEEVAMERKAVTDKAKEPETEKPAKEEKPVKGIGTEFYGYLAVSLILLAVIVFCINRIRKKNQ